MYDSLDDAVSVFEESKILVARLNMGDLEEIRCLHKPPVAVQLVLEALCISMDIAPVVENVMGFSAENYDAAAKRFLNHLNFATATMKRVMRQGLRRDTAKRLRKYLSTPELRVEAVEKVCKSAAGLCAWIHGIYAQWTVINWCLHRLLDEDTKKIELDSLPADLRKIVKGQLNGFRTQRPRRRFRRKKKRQPKVTTTKPEVTPPNVIDTDEFSSQRRGAPLVRRQSPTKTSAENTGPSKPQTEDEAREPSVTVNQPLAYTESSSHSRSNEKVSEIIVPLSTICDHYGITAASIVELNAESEPSHYLIKVMQALTVLLRFIENPSTWEQIRAMTKHVEACMDLINGFEKDAVSGQQLRTFERYILDKDVILFQNQDSLSSTDKTAASLVRFMRDVYEYCTDKIRRQETVLFCDGDELRVKVHD